VREVPRDPDFFRISWSCVPHPGRPAVLALQLSFCFEVRALSGGLVSSAPE
jgi:hypothetical protein